MHMLYLTLVACFSASVTTAVTVGQEQLFKLVVRVIQQPTQRDPFDIEGYYVSSTDFITNERESILIPKSGFTTSQGETVYPENYYTNGSATVRQSTTAADAERPFAFLIDTWSYAPAGYCSTGINYDYASDGMKLFSNVTGQPYFGDDNPPNNYNVPDAAEGHFLACEPDEGLGPQIQFYISQGITDPNAEQPDCAQIRLLPECAGNFASDEPEGVQLNSCYDNAEAAPLPKLSN